MDRFRDRIVKVSYEAARRTAIDKFAAALKRADFEFVPTKSLEALLIEIKGTWRRRRYYAKSLRWKRRARRWSIWRNAKPFDPDSIRGKFPDFPINEIERARRRTWITRSEVPEGYMGDMYVDSDGVLRPGVEHWPWEAMHTDLNCEGWKPTIKISQTELEYFGTHFAELREKYPDQWLAIEGEELVAHDPNVLEVCRLAEAKGYSNPVLVQACQCTDPHTYMLSYSHGCKHFNPIII